MKAYHFFTLAGLSSVLLLNPTSAVLADDDDYDEYRRGPRRMQATPVAQGGNCVDSRTLVMEFPAQELSNAEQQALRYLRSEEKLARDVYNTLYGQWQLRIFSNIPRSEQRHFEAVEALLDKYRLPDPEAATAPGEYGVTEFNALYTRLTAQGRESLAAALQAGAMIEEKDILDLEESLQNTDNLDVRFVYQNLLKGSRNHLRAFMGLLRAQGGDYTPQYLSRESFDAILASPKENRMVYDDAGELVMLCGGQGQGRGLGRGYGRGAKDGARGGAQRRVELYGRIAALDGNAATLDTRSGSVQVDLSHARFKYDDGAQLQVGAEVEIKGLMQGGYLQAWEVELED